VKIDDIVTMADDQIECNFEEVRMYTLIEIAKTLKGIENTLGAIGEHFVNNDHVV
jgi:hypothetical protein